MEGYRPGEPGMVPVDSSRGGATVYVLPTVPYEAPNALETVFVYQNVIDNRKSVFSALPGDLDVTQTGETNEDPPTPIWRATVPTPGGTTRYYYANSQDGPYISIIDYGTTFEKAGTGYVETVRGFRRRWGPILARPTDMLRLPFIPDSRWVTPPVQLPVLPVESRVYYDSEGKIQRNERGRAVHTYEYFEDYVEIHANTRPPTKMRIDLVNDQVDEVTLFIQIPQWGWIAIWSTDVSWSGDVIAYLALAPADLTTSFTYHDDGSLASIEDSGGRKWTLRYEELEEG